MPETVRSTCPYDCPDACGLLVDVEDGLARRVRGDADHPHSRGSLCTKMNRYELTVHSPRRLTTPLVRTGPKGLGEFRAATWDEALALIASRFRAIIEADGAEAILPYSYAGTMGLLQRNAGHAFFHRLGASRLERTICSPAKEAAWNAVMGGTPGPDPEEAAQSDLVVLWGINAIASNVHFVTRALDARRNGAQVWLIDTHRTETARVADRVILVKPGSDGALALGMMHVLHRDGLTDQAFLAEQVQGWDDLQPAPTRLVNMNWLGHALTQLDAPRVMALYVYHSNPAAIAPDQNQVLAGLGRDDLFTVVHERFMTDTAKYADVVLPATTSLEHADLYRGYGHYYAQRVSAAIPPVGESRSNWDVFCALARAMGFDDEVFAQSVDQMLDRLLEKPSSFRASVTPDDMAHGKAFRLDPPARTWKTPSGRIEILNRTLSHPLPVVLPTHASTDPEPLVLQTAVSMFALNSSFRERDELVMREGPMRIKLSPADATARHIGEGDRVVVWNALGSVDFILEVTDDVPDGVAIAEGVHWQAHAPRARTVNALTSQRLTDEGAGSTFYDNRVDVRRA